MDRQEELDVIYKGAYVRSGTLVGVVISVNVEFPDPVIGVELPDGEEIEVNVSHTELEPISPAEYFRGALQYVPQAR